VLPTRVGVPLVLERLESADEHRAHAVWLDHDVEQAVGVLIDLTAGGRGSGTIVSGS
jgi:hypothetical protein